MLKNDIAREEISAQIDAIQRDKYRCQLLIRRNSAIPIRDDAHGAEIEKGNAGLQGSVEALEKQEQAMWAEFVLHGGKKPEPEAPDEAKPGAAEKPADAGPVAAAEIPAETPAEIPAETPAEAATEALVEVTEPAA